MKMIRDVLDLHAKFRQLVMSIIVKDMHAHIMDNKGGIRG
jgi:hypothetical protein